MLFVAAVPIYYSSRKLLEPMDFLILISSFLIFKLHVLFQNLGEKHSSYTMNLFILINETIKLNKLCLKYNCTSASTSFLKSVRVLTLSFLRKPVLNCFVMETHGLDQTGRFTQLLSHES
jgi:hypothetical protein